MRKMLSALAFLFVVTGSALAADTPLKGYSHDNNKVDMFGYYQPVQPLKAGKFRLEQLSIASPQDLTKYEKGKDRMPTWAPVMFMFSDMTSRKMINAEMGNEYYANAPRVLPSAYRIKGNTIAFEGKDKQIGMVRFVGTFDLKPVRKAQKDSMLVAEKPVMWGDLTIGKQTFKSVAFTWFGGD